MHADRSRLDQLSGQVIGCAFTVLNTLGAGFLEKVYENALAYELRAAGLSAVQQHGAKVHYKDILGGEYFVDLPIDDMLLVELKIVKALDDAHMRSGAGPEGRMQCTNYLKATGLQLYLLLNFGKPRLEIKRVAHAYEPRRLICVFCVHRLPASALKFFLDLQRGKLGNASQDCARSQRVRASNVVRLVAFDLLLVEGHSDGDAKRN